MIGSVHNLVSGHMRKTADGLAPVRSLPRHMPVRSRDRLRLLAETIEAQIVPRLVAGYEQAQAPEHWDRDRATESNKQETAVELVLAPISRDAMDLAVQVLGEDEERPRATITNAVARIGLEPVCLELLAPAARHLGDLWTEDLCSFTDVTIGLMRLQSALLHITVPLPDQVGALSPRRTALLAPVPGDRHNFGLTMIAGSLERAGWTVTHLHDGSPETVEAALRANWYGVLGLSAGSDAKMQTLPRMLPRLRTMSRNPDLGVLVGGPLFLADPARASEIGADATAADGPSAVVMAEKLIAPERATRRASRPDMTATG